MTYKPMPEKVELKPSGIHGYGVLAAEDIGPNYMIGMSHVILFEDGDQKKNIIRTPLGGYINHSDSPNCERIVKGKYHYIKTIKALKVGQELTVKYKLSKV